MEATLNIYKSIQETCGGDSSDPEQEDYFELNDNFTHLTRLIRSQYFTYLKKIIQQNYTEWKNHQTESEARTIDDEYLENCAAYFEERAVRYCMVVQLYRKYMLRIISEIRRETTCCELISKLKQYQCKSEAKVDVQTVNIKNEFPDSHVTISKVGYKRKCQKNEEYSKKFNRIESTNGEGVFSDQETKDNPMQCKSLAAHAFPSYNGEHSNGSIEIRPNDDKSSNGSPFWPTQKPVLVPYESEGENSQSSRTADCAPEAGTVAIENNSPIAQSSQVPYELLSLQEKIQKFEETLQKRDQTCDEIVKKPPIRRKRNLPRPEDHKVNMKLSISQALSPVSTSSEEEESKPATPDDNIAKDLESLFGEDKKTTEFEDIFGDSTYNPEVALILREIENSHVPGCVESNVKAPNVARTTCKRSAGSEKKSKRYKLQPLVCDLRQSLWPCELHMWKQRLREILGQLAEVDIRHHDQIRNRFDQLFGEDSDDEFAPYSPSLELDEILISSCMKRIAPIIVRHLMHPMKEGLIANRYLFKKLAKKFAYNIIVVDQYADEEHVKEQIDLFFCAGRRVDNLYDIESV